MPGPTPIFGAATTPGVSHITADTVQDLLAVVEKTGINRIDAGARYPPTVSDDELLGRIGFVGSDSLETEDVEVLDDESTRERFTRLGFCEDNVLYCHVPDPSLSIHEIAALLDLRLRNGDCKRFGVSNFPHWALDELLDVCEEFGYTKPSVYQGQYNLLCRGAETEIIPLLRKHGIVFDAFSPLACGFLAGRLGRGYLDEARHEEGDLFGVASRSSYDIGEMHRAIQNLEEVLEPYNIPLAEAAVRWIFHHSMLKTGDGVILNGSKPQYIEESMMHIERGPLPTEVVEEIERVWDQVAAVAP